MRTLIILCAAGAVAGCTMQPSQPRALVAATAVPSNDCMQVAHSRTLGVSSSSLGEAIRAEYNACLYGRTTPTIVYR